MCLFVSRVRQEKKITLLIMPNEEACFALCPVMTGHCFFFVPRTPETSPIPDLPNQKLMRIRKVCRRTSSPAKGVVGFGGCGCWWCWIRSFHLNGFSACICWGLLSVRVSRFTSFNCQLAGCLRQKFALD